MSRVDVFVPCYNYAAYLRECVESILSQSAVDVRVLVIDDASSDESAKVAEQLVAEDERVEVHRHDVNRGHIATFNEGIDWAVAEYVMLLSADDYLLPGALGRAVSLLDRHAGVGFAFGGVIEVDESGPTATITPFAEQLAGRSETVLSGEAFVRLSGCRNIVPTPTVVVRTDLQKRVGGYRSELPHSGDMEMWLRLSVFGDAGVIAAPMAVKRSHASNMSLAYTGRNKLRDIQQRRAAIACYRQTCQQAIQVHRGVGDLEHQLATESLEAASGAFNEGDLDTVHRLAELALETDSRVTRSHAWAKLRIKTWLGPSRWTFLRSTFSSFPRLLTLPGQRRAPEQGPVSADREA